MKVRHKNFYGATAPIEVHEWGKDTPYYFPTDTLNHGVTLPREHYEPVPEERWVDVTADCVFQKGEYFHSKIMHNRTVVMACMQVDYRVIKKQFPCQPLKEDHDGFHWQDAFIVEKKESR